MADRKTIKFGPEWLRNVANPVTSSGNGVENNPSPETIQHRGPPNMPQLTQRGGVLSVAPKYQRAEFRYGREELLAIFDIDLEPPPYLQRFESLYVTSAQLPFALSEKNYDSDLGDNTNTEVAGRGAVPADRFGQPKRGIPESSFRGKNAFGGYPGRGRSTYEVNTSETRPTTTTRSWSSSSTSISTNSAKSPVSDDWNSRNQKNRWTETSNWRRKPQNTQTGKSYGEESDGCAWRNSDNCQTRQAANNDKSRGDYAGRGVRYTPRRQWSGDINNADDHLPEWAIDSGTNSGGTFDSSGAFHGTNDDSVLNRSTGDGFHGLARSQTQGSISIKKEIHHEDGPVEDWWDSEKARKLQPPKLPTVDFKHGKPIVPKFEEKGETESSRESDNENKSELIQIENSEPEPVKQHKIADKINVERREEPKEVRNDKQEQDAVIKQHNSQRLLEEVKLNTAQSYSDPVNCNKSQLEQENEHLLLFQQSTTRPVAQQLFNSGLHPDADKWFYEDPQRETQGPFTSSEMLQWWREGFFTSELRVRRGGESRMRALWELGPVPPFVLDSLPPTASTALPQAYCYPSSRNIESSSGIFGVSPRETMEPAFSSLQRVLPKYHTLPPEPMPPTNLNAEHLSNLYKLKTDMRHNFNEEPMESLTRPMMTNMGQERSSYVSNNIDHIPVVSYPPRVSNVGMISPQNVIAMPPDLTIPYPTLLNHAPQHPTNNKYQNISNNQPPPELESLWNAPNPMANMRWPVSESNTAPENPLWDAPSAQTPKSFLAPKNLEDHRKIQNNSIEQVIPPVPITKPIKHVESVGIRESMMPNVLEVSQLESKVHEEVKNSLLDISKSQSIQQSVEASKTKVEPKPHFIVEPKMTTKSSKTEKKEIAKEVTPSKQQQQPKVDVEKQNKAKAKSKENIQIQKKKKEEDKSVRDELPRNTAQAANSRPAPWSATAAIDPNSITNKLTLDEIQRLEREKKAEQLKEQQQAVQILAQQNQAALAREQEIQFSWSKNKSSGGSGVTVKSLAVIQAEEAKRVAANPPPAPPVVEPVSVASIPWSSNAKQASLSGFWDTLPSSNNAKVEKSSKSNANPPAAKKQTKQPQTPAQQPTNNNSKQSNNNSKQANNNSKPANNSSKQSNAGTKKSSNNNMEFDTWCIDALKPWSYKIDVPTFIGFLKDIESPFEVKDYVKCYLGESKETQDFSKQFIEKRSKLLRKSVVLSVDDLCSPAPALNSAASMDYNDAKNKAKKAKKNKMQKVDARILGFSVTASEDRINVGDIDTV